jgi:hypothetical protein
MEKPFLQVVIHDDHREQQQVRQLIHQVDHVHIYDDDVQQHQLEVPNQYDHELLLDSLVMVLMVMVRDLLLHLLVIVHRWQTILVHHHAYLVLYEVASLFNQQRHHTFGQTVSIINPQQTKTTEEYQSVALE